MTEHDHEFPPDEDLHAFGLASRGLQVTDLTMKLFLSWMMTTIRKEASRDPILQSEGPAWSAHLAKAIESAQQEGRTWYIMFGEPGDSDD